MRFTFNPLTAMFSAPTADDVLRRQLRDAEVMRAEHAANREYHASVESMLNSRIKRLRRELAVNAPKETK